MCACAAASRRPSAALAVLLPLAFASRAAGRSHSPIAVMTCPKLSGKRLPGELVQHRLRIERVDVAGAAFHEQEDHALRARRKVSRFGRQLRLDRELGFRREPSPGSAARPASGASRTPRTAHTKISRRVYSGSTCGTPRASSEERRSACGSRHGSLVVWQCFNNRLLFERRDTNPKR